jgi:hypothetical protein
MGTMSLLLYMKSMHLYFIATISFFKAFISERYKWHACHTCHLGKSQNGEKHCICVYIYIVEESFLFKLGVITRFTPPYVL